MSAWWFWKAYEGLVLEAPHSHRTGAGIVLGPAGLLVSLYSAGLSVRRTFDDHADLIIDRRGISDRWLGSGPIPWEAIQKIESQTHGKFFWRQRTALAIRLKERDIWIRRGPWYVRAIRQVGRFVGIPEFTLPSIASGLPINLEFLLWLVAQYRPTLVTEPLEIDPFSDDLLYEPPVQIVEAMRAIYGADAEEVVEWRLKHDEERHAPKWKEVQKGLALSYKRAS